MAKIRLENLIQDLALKSPESKRLSALPPQNTAINQLQPQSDDSVVNRTRKKLSLEEAIELGRGLFEQFAKDPESATTQGAGLTEARVNALLSDD